MDPDSDDSRVRVWRPRGECLNPAIALQRHTAPTAGGMVWGDIAYNTRSPLVLIRGTMTTQRYVHDVMQPHVLSLMQRLPGAIFQQDNAQPHTSLNELGARLQQISNEMCQDIIQNLYASMPDHIALCIRARGGSTGY
ncbi:transposable element Tcb2 transposase [Trichonephila clavipes]|nr:transposable element Tcb2 transposase [Trichonephila clavipes]